jgi:hypothetical protein
LLSGAISLVFKALGAWYTLGIPDLSRTSQCKHGDPTLVRSIMRERKEGLTGMGHFPNLI